jgi:peptidoglycan hydrolase-like amidase
MQNFFKKYTIRQKSARKQFALFTFLVFFAVFFTYLFVNGLSDNAIMQKEAAGGKIVPLYFYKDADTQSFQKHTETLSLKEKENPLPVFYNTEITDIRLKNALSGQVETLPLERYIVGVVLAEVPASFEYEAIKAQAVAARTYAVNSITSKNSKHKNADICTDYRCCQAYINKDAFLKKYNDTTGNSAYEKIKKAVSETSDIVMLYNSEVIQAFFHAASGKSTAAAKRSKNVFKFFISN